MSLRIIFLAIIFCLLQACASPYFGEEFQLGKKQFIAGDFNEAFRELLPIAVKGNAEAQYAVGYMYYNGLGVPQDAISGIFWMQKAAVQHYRPAESALAMASRKCVGPSGCIVGLQPAEGFFKS